MNRAVFLYRDLGDKSGQASALSHLALLYGSTSEFKKTLEILQQVRSINQSLGDKRAESETLAAIGLAYTRLNQYQKALESYEDAITNIRASGDRGGEATIIFTIGLNYVLLGEKQKALESFQKALSIYVAIESKWGEAGALMAIGRAYLDFEEFDKSLEYSNRALLLFRAMGDKKGEAGALNNLGVSQINLKKYPEAMKSFRETLKIQRNLHDLGGEALALLNIGYGYQQQGDEPKALENLTNALLLSRRVGNILLEATTLGTLAEHWKKRGVSRLAVFYGKQAVNIIQLLRSRISGLKKETQDAYIKQYEKSYRKFADLLIETGRIAEAEKVLAMLKEEEYFDYLGRDDKVADELTSKISLTPEEQKAFDGYKQYADTLTALGNEYGELQLDSQRYPVGKFPRQSRIDELDKLLANASKVFNTFLDNLKAEFGEKDKRVGENDKRIASVESGTQAWLKELNQPKTVIISTIASEDRLNLIVTTSDTQRAHTVDIKSADLEKLAIEFRSAVKNSRIDPRISGKKLYDVLFPASLQKDLDGVKADTIVWSLDGTLRYVPIAALWDGKQYVAERYTTVLMTLASRDKISNSPADRTKWQALGVGVSKQTTLTDADGTPRSFEALTSVPDELCSVIEDPNKKTRCSNINNGRNGVVLGKNQCQIPVHRIPV